MVLNQVLTLDDEIYLGKTELKGRRKEKAKDKALHQLAASVILSILHQYGERRDRFLVFTLVNVCIKIYENCSVMAEHEATDHEQEKGLSKQLQHAYLSYLFPAEVLMSLFTIAKRLSLH